VTTPLLHRLPRAGFYLASALVGALSLVPSSALPAVSISDKVEHALAYVALGLLGVATSKRSAIRTILGVSLLGFALELLQAFSPGRSPDIADALVDVIGACLGGGSALVLRSAASIAIDKVVRAAEPCRTRTGSSDSQSAPDVRTTRSFPSTERASCVSN
jgi:VanZ family protein